MTPAEQEGYDRIFRVGKQEGYDDAFLRQAAAVAYQESGFRQVPGGAGEFGIFQLMPGTARAVGLRVEAGNDERRDIDKNIQGGLRYLSGQIGKYGPEKGLDAYNKGTPGARGGDPNYVANVQAQYAYLHGQGSSPSLVAAPGGTPRLPSENTALTGIIRDMVHGYKASQQEEGDAPARVLVGRRDMVHGIVEPLPLPPQAPPTNTGSAPAGFIANMVANYGRQKGPTRRESLEEEIRNQPPLAEGLTQDTRQAGAALVSAGLGAVGAKAVPMLTGSGHPALQTVASYIGQILGSYGGRKANVESGLEDPGPLGDTLAVALPALGGAVPLARGLARQTRAGRAITTGTQQAQEANLANEQAVQARNVAQEEAYQSAQTARQEAGTAHQEAIRLSRNVPSTYAPTETSSSIYTTLRTTHGDIPIPTAPIKQRLLESLGDRAALPSLIDKRIAEIEALDETVPFRRIHEYLNEFNAMARSSHGDLRNVAGRINGAFRDGLADAAGASQVADEARALLLKGNQSYRTEKALENVMGMVNRAISTNHGEQVINIDQLSTQLNRAFNDPQKMLFAGSFTPQQRTKMLGDFEAIRPATGTPGARVRAGAFPQEPLPAAPVVSPEQETEMIRQALPGEGRGIGTRLMRALVIGQGGYLAYQGNYKTGLILAGAELAREGASELLAKAMLSDTVRPRMIEFLRTTGGRITPGTLEGIRAALQGDIDRVAEGMRPQPITAQPLPAAREESR